MLQELKTRQILEYKKLLKIVLDGLDSASKVRQGLLEYDSVSKFEYARFDSYNDPEPYYHIKLFDMAIGIVRIYEKRQWVIEDDEGKYFHFTIRCYNFRPTSNSNIQIVRSTRETTDYGEFLEISDCMRYFYDFTKELIIKKFDFPTNLFYEIY